MLKIVKDVMAILKASDEHKVEKFFNRQIKFLEREIIVIEQNMESDVQEHNFLVSEYADRIEDQEELLASTWLEIPESALVSNTAMDEFGETYRNRIKQEENTLVNLKNSKSKIVESFQEQAKADKEELNKLADWVEFLRAK